ncbi:uncharacterized protein EDB91DRAFT_1253620 [Suillus paluster]|uniref:uncharacterized protein n=1 Tax=Suillus paluster TaxID=48578 RepID=UPI001B87F0C7|nr:uncharacterized protein EDB91DRAFT_1253620 [Suillus paluster]KAG1728035.1 hypothetical protein EDB91DRAFT_1253620 [Suillus paluster]
MPRQSTHKEILDIVDQATLSLAKLQYQDILDDLSDSDSDFGTDSESDSEDLLSSTLDDISTINLDSSLSSSDCALPYGRLHDTIAALHDEVERAHVLHKPDEPPPQAPQLHMLVHHEEHCPELFRQKLQVNPEIFDDILDHISSHPIFQNGSNNPQLPISIQLAIFLNWAGHYGNAITLQDVTQWAGICVRVKHTSAVLKGRFQSLRELRFHIQAEKDLEFVVQWIKCCIILHNMIIRFKIHHQKQDGTYKSSLNWAHDEGEDFFVQEPEGLDGDEVVGDRTYEGTPGQGARAKLMDMLFDSPYSNAQCRAE